MFFCGIVIKKDQPYKYLLEDVKSFFTERKYFKVVRIMENFIRWLRYLPENIDPIAFEIGPIQFRYYGLFFFMAFMSVYLIVSYQIKKGTTPFDRDLIDEYFLWTVFAVVIGGRMGYVLLYNLPYYWNNPMEIFLPVRFSGGLKYVGFSGMSYHGALSAGILSTVVFCRIKKIDLWMFADLFSVALPIGHIFGRLGNFMNGELYGRVTGVLWGMYFPGDTLRELRHPSQLYQAFFEGFLLFLLLWLINKKTKTPGITFCFYLIGYGTFRFFVEFFRQPDVQLGFVLGSLSMGQFLSLIMILAGNLLLIFRINRLPVKER